MSSRIHFNRCLYAENVQLLKEETELLFKLFPYRLFLLFG